MRRSPSLPAAAPEDKEKRKKTKTKKNVDKLVASLSYSIPNRYYPSSMNKLHRQKKKKLKKFVNSKRFFDPIRTKKWKLSLARIINCTATSLQISISWLHYMSDCVIAENLPRFWKVDSMKGLSVFLGCSLGCVDDKSSLYTDTNVRKFTQPRCDPCLRVKPLIELTRRVTYRLGRL